MSLSSGQPRPGLTCNACGICFDNREVQRTHMREPWHVINLKRRITDLAPIPKSAYEETIHRPKTPDDRSESSEEAAGNDDDDDDGKELEHGKDVESPSQCLFCPKNSTAVDTNLSHMLRDHGFFVSHLDHLIDSEAFLGYLRTVITTCHECLYCGSTRSTTEGIQQHMLDKGHCLLNIEAEPELLEFWDFPDSSGDEDGEGELAAAFVSKASEIPVLQKLSDTEIRLARGVVVGARPTGPSGQVNRKKRAAVREAKMQAIEAIPSEEQTAEQPHTTLPIRDRSIIRRGELGMVGVTDQQKRALMAVEKKAQKQDEIIRASHRWALDNMTNKQKRYRRIIAKKGCVPMNAHLM